MSAAKIHKGYCAGCPFNYGDPATEMAWNLGCLPGSHEVLADCKAEGKAWACHSEPDEVCCGFAASAPDDVDKPLMLVEGVHFS